LKVYRCPADRTQSNDPFYGPCSYGTNNLLCARRVHLPGDVPDGAAYTIFFAEKYAACSQWARSEGRETPWYVADENSGFQNRPVECDPALPQTPHRAGMMVGMVDGSVRLVSAEISPLTWYAANTPAGEETLGPDW
jgi:hypothetical protein